MADTERVGIHIVSIPGVYQIAYSQRPSSLQRLTPTEWMKKRRSDDSNISVARIYHQEGCEVVVPVLATHKRYQDHQLKTLSQDVYDQVIVNNPHHFGKGASIHYKDVLAQLKAIESQIYLAHHYWAFWSLTDLLNLQPSDQNGAVSIGGELVKVTTY